MVRALLLSQFAAVERFSTEGPRILVGPGENAGVVDLSEAIDSPSDREHNHPSAVELFQGRPGGGILRDIFTMGAGPSPC